MNRVDQYLQDVQNEVFRRTLEQLRELILSELPDAEQTISYGIPTFKVNGKNIVHFAAFKNHCSFFPGGIAEEYADRLPGHKISKGTIQFRPDNLIPEVIVRELIRHALKRNT